MAESDDVRPARLAVELAPTGEARRDPASNPVRVAEQAGVRSCPASRGSDIWTPGAYPGISDRLDGWSSGTEAACAVRGSIEQGLRLGIGTVIDTLSRFCGAFFRSG